MTTTLRRRVDRIESEIGDPLERWARSLSDEDLDAQIAEIGASLRADMEARGHDCTGHASSEVAKLARMVEAGETL